MPRLTHHRVLLGQCETTSGWGELPTHTPMAMAQGESRHQAGGGQGDPAWFSPARIRESVSTEDLKCFNFVHPESHGCQERQEGNAGTKHTAQDCLQLQHVCLGREDREIPSACADNGHFSHTSCSEKAKDKQALPPPLLMPPLNSQNWMQTHDFLTTQDY